MPTHLGGSLASRQHKASRPIQDCTGHHQSEISYNITQISDGDKVRCGEPPHHDAAGTVCRFEGGIIYQVDIFSVVMTKKAASHFSCCSLCRRHAVMSQFSGEADGCMSFTFHEDTLDCILHASLPYNVQKDMFVTSGVVHR